MNNQESMFTDFGQQSPRPQPGNPDPREQPPWQDAGLETSEPGNGGKLHPQPPQPWWRGVVALVIVLVLLIALAGAAFGAISSWTSATSSPITRTFTVGVPARLIVNTGNGTIHVHTGSATSVVVQVTKQGGGFGGAAPQIILNQTDSTTVRIETRSSPGFFLGFRSVDIDVTMPSASSVQLQSGSGGIQIEGINGQVNAETGSGSISVTDLNGQITLNTGSGSVNLTLPASAGLSLDPHTGSGSIINSFGSNETGGTPRAKVFIQTGSGSITINKG